MRALDDARARKEGHRRFRWLRAALPVLAGLAGLGCGGPALMNVPAVPGLSWQMKSLTRFCPDEIPGAYLQAQVTRLAAPRNRMCRVDRLLFNCHQENVSVPFAIADRSDGNPGPWRREGYQRLDLYPHNLGGGDISSFGSVTLAFDELTLRALSKAQPVRASVSVDFYVPGSPSSYRRTLLASIREDMEQTTAPSHTFAMPLTQFAPWLAVVGEASGDSAGLPFLVTSGAFVARGAANARFSVCQEVRLVNRADQCVVIPDGAGSPMAIACHGASAVNVHVDAETGNLVLLADFHCLTVDRTPVVGGRFAVQGRVCARDLSDIQQWGWMSDGTLRPIGLRRHCLVPDSSRPVTRTDFRGDSYTLMPMVVQTCVGGSAQQWRFY